VTKQVGITVCALFFFAACATASPRSGVDDFNKALSDATRQMSNSAVLELWEEDGTCLLPSTPPLIGKKAIAAFLEKVTEDLKGGHVETFDSECHDIQVSGDWATEWCVEHQVVVLADGTKHDGRGKMLFVLHRGADRKWRIKREMWNQAVAP